MPLYGAHTSTRTASAISIVTIGCVTENIPAVEMLVIAIPENQVRTTNAWISPMPVSRAICTQGKLSLGKERVAVHILRTTHDIIAERRVTTTTGLAPERNANEDKI